MVCGRETLTWLSWQTVYKLEIALLRLYVVNAVKTGHREKAVEFFKSFISFLAHYLLAYHRSLRPVAMCP